MPSHLSATKVFAVSYLAALDPRYYPLVRQPCAAAAKPVLVVSRPCTRLWRDWLFVGSQAAMAPFWSASILTASAVLANMSVRCWGWCPEEQNELQLRAAGVTLGPLENVSLFIERVPPNVSFWPADTRQPCAGGSEQYDWVRPEANRTALRAYKYVRMRRHKRLRPWTVLTSASANVRRERV